ncbi:MAG TPA: energy transducer TonB [Polyangia bacterium]|nr:energy transducer TonB [Polyangia bacterium]
MRRLTPTAGYAIAAALHLGLFAWAWALPSRPHRKEQVDVEIVETVKPRPVEPKPPPPEPPKPPEPVKVQHVHRVALAPPPPTNAPPPPPDTPPPETPPPTTPTTTPGPVHLGLSLSSTSVGGAFAAPVGNSLAGKPGPRAAAPAVDDVGPVVHAAALTVQPEPIDTEIPRSEYPQAALDAGFEGSVTLKIVIDATGKVRRATVMKDPGYGLGAAAVRSVLKHFRFKPGEIDGKPVAIETPFIVTYEVP